jgi:hypothetical protein
MTMKSSDLIRSALRMSDGYTAALVEGLQNAAMKRATTGPDGTAGNHPLWTMGHLAVVEGQVPVVILGESHPVEQWLPLFGMGTQPKDNASAYPPFDEIVKKYRELRSNTLRIVDQLGEAGLERAPKKVPPGFEKEMQTNGQALLLIGMHNMAHCGQLSVIRRSMGLKPIR